MNFHTKLMDKEQKQGPAKTRTQRFEVIDLIRGIAVLLMIIFHFTYDLAMFKFIALSFKKNQDPFWWFLPRIIVFLFMLSMGMSMGLAHSKQIKWKGFLKRLLKLTILALLISIATYLAFPKRWIYFGTLHSIATCSILILPLLKLKKINLLIFILLFIPAAFFDYNFPWWELKHPSMDYIPPLPWLGSACLGLYLYKKNVHTWKLPKTKAFRFIYWLGKHSLIIYLLHQPLLYSLIACAKYLSS